MQHPRSALKGALVGTTTAIAAFAGVTVALAATQAGVNETQKPLKSTTTVQAGVVEAQASTPRAKPRPTASPTNTRARPVVQQAGIADATEVKARTAKKDTERGDHGAERVASEAEAPRPPAAAQQKAAAPAPAPIPRQAPSYPVQQAPAPIRQAPVQQAPAPAPAPVQQAPAPAPAPAPEPVRVVPHLPVVPQEPIPINPVRIG